MFDPDKRNVERMLLVFTLYARLFQRKRCSDDKKNSINKQIYSESFE